MTDEQKAEHAKLIHKWGCSDITPEQITRLEELDSISTNTMTTDTPSSRDEEIPTPRTLEQLKEVIETYDVDRYRSVFELIQLAEKQQSDLIRLSAEREDLITRQKIASDLLEYDRKEIFLMKDTLAERDKELAEVKAEVEHLESAFDGRSEELSKMTADRDTFHDECIRLRRHIKNTEEEIEAKRQYVKECNHLPELVIGSEDGYICCECWAIEQEKRADELTAQLLAAQTVIIRLEGALGAIEKSHHCDGDGCEVCSLLMDAPSSPDPTLLDEVVKTVSELIETMLMQEKRESGRFHINAETANCMWQDAKERGRNLLSHLRQSTRETEREGL